MKRFKSSGMRNGSCPRSAASRHTSGRVGICFGATEWRTEMADRFAVWNVRSPAPDAAA